MQDALLPDRDKTHFLVPLLLALVQQRFPGCAVPLCGLLRVPSVDLGVVNPRLCSRARHVGLQAWAGVAPGSMLTAA